MVTLGAPVIAFLLARVTAQQGQVIRANEEIHKTVNSNHEKVVAELAESRKEVKDTAMQLSDATSLIATLTEHRRASDAIRDARGLAAELVNVTTPVVNVTAPSPEVHIQEKES